MQNLIMKKKEYVNKGLMPVTVYLSKSTLKALSAEGRKHKRSRKAQTELVLAEWANKEKQDVI